VLRTEIAIPASLLAFCVASVSADPFNLDFESEMVEWMVVVDGVMGGRSTGQVARVEPGVLQFSGELSLANNGGFSQMRSDVSGDQFAGMRGIEIMVRGDGRTYNFDIRCANARVMAGGFQRSFDTTGGEWTVIRLPFDEFRLYTFGRPVPDAPAIVPTMIESIGVTLSDKQQGPFRLEIASIRAFGDEVDQGQATNLDLDALSRRLTLERLLDLADANERDPAPGAVSATASAEAVRLTELAITRGAPLFNDGHPAACAAIYEVTIEAMVALGAEDLGRPAVARLSRSLVEAKTDRSPRERAWTYRRALDDAYVHLTRQANRGRGVSER
jgi:monofunctional biosynthetic peptidoglycan transglycosylase